MEEELQKTEILTKEMTIESDNSTTNTTITTNTTTNDVPVRRGSVKGRLAELIEERKKIDAEKVSKIKESRGIEGTGSVKNKWQEAVANHKDHEAKRFEETKETTMSGFRGSHIVGELIKKFNKIFVQKKLAGEKFVRRYSNLRDVAISSGKIGNNNNNSNNNNNNENSNETNDTNGSLTHNDNNNDNNDGNNNNQSKITYDTSPISEEAGINYLNGISKAINSLTSSDTYQHRQLWAKLSLTLLKYLPKETFETYFLHYVLKLTSDPVLNVRINIAEMLTGWDVTNTPPPWECQNDEIICPWVYLLNRNDIQECIQRLSQDDHDVYLSIIKLKPLFPYLEFRSISCRGMKYAPGGAMPVCGVEKLNNHDRNSDDGHVSDGKISRSSSLSSHDGNSISDISDISGHGLNRTNSSTKLASPVPIPNLGVLRVDEVEFSLDAEMDGNFIDFDGNVTNCLHLQSTESEDYDEDEEKRVSEERERLEKEDKTLTSHSDSYNSPTLSNDRVFSPIQNIDENHENNDNNNNNDNQNDVSSTSTTTTTTTILTTTQNEGENQDIQESDSILTEEEKSEVKEDVKKEEDNLTNANIDSNNNGDNNSNDNNGESNELNQPAEVENINVSDSIPISSNDSNNDNDNNNNNNDTEVEQNVESSPQNPEEAY